MHNTTARRKLIDASIGWFETLEQRSLMSLSSEPATLADFAALYGTTASQLQSQNIETVLNGSKSELAYADEFLLRLNGFAGTADAQVAAAQQWVNSRSVSAQVLRQLGENGLFQISSTLSHSALAAGFAGSPTFAYVEPNGVVFAQDRTPNDTQWLNAGQYGLRKIEAPAAWDTTVGGNSSLVVAVLDSGIDYLHPDLLPNMWQNLNEIPNNSVDDDGNGRIDDRFGFNFVGTNSSNPFDDSVNGHGTHAAGIIAGRGNNNAGITGINWQAQLMAIKVLDNNGLGSIADAVEGFNYLTMMLGAGVNVRVTNVSWGTTGNNASLQTAISGYTTAGGLVIAAAGNNSNQTNFYPAAYSASNSGVIAVASSTETDAKASNSNFGSWVNIAAPGANIYSTLPNQQYGLRSGTSQAAPHVAGAVLLLWDAAGLTTSATTIRNAIVNNTDALPPSWSSTPIAALAGRLNVNKAIQTLSLPWNVTTTTPANGSLVIAAQTQFTVNFSAPYLATSVQASDFQVNGIPADTFVAVDVDTITFEFASSPMTVSGAQTMSISAGSILRNSDSGAIAAFNGLFNYDAVALAPVFSSPAIGSTVALPFVQLDVMFNEALNPASVSAGDLVLTVGTATSATLINPTTIRFGISGLSNETLTSVTATIAPGAVTDAFGFAGTAYVSSFALTSAGDAPIPALTAVEPLGSMVYQSPVISGSINPATDQDGYTIYLNEGQTLSVSVAGGSSLAVILNVFDPDNNLVGEAAVVSVGGTAVLESLPILSSGTYSLVVRSASGTTGAYDMVVTLNAGAEIETHNTPSSAQPLAPSDVPLVSGATRTTIAGSMPAEAAQVESVIYSDEFASSLGSAWTTYSSLGNGRVRVSSAFGGYDSPSALLMDRSGSGTFILNEATWTVDLSGIDNPVFRFATVNLGDEHHPMPATFTGRGNFDGVAVSADGVTWHRVYSPPAVETANLYVPITVDLEAAAAAAGIPLGANFRIKFQQYDNGAIPVDGRGYDAASISGIPAQEDWYSFDAAAGESISAAIDTVGTSTPLVLQVYSPTLTLLGTAALSGGAIDEVIDNLLVTATGTHYLRVSGTVLVEEPYRLLFTQQSAMDLEPNSTRSVAQDLPASGIASGFVGGSDTGDFYRFNVRAGDVLQMVTSTPAGQSSAGFNLLDPALELYGPNGELLASDSGNGPDTINAFITYDALTAGVYTVRVLADADSGDYTLQVSGNTGGPLPFAATGVQPAAGSYLISPLGQIVLDFSQSINSTTVNASDLLINGTPAASVVQTDRNTLIFTPTSPLGENSYTLTIASGAITSVSGSALSAVNSNFVIDLTPPTVVTSSISEGSYLGLGDLTYTATFNEDLIEANLDDDDFVLRGLGLGVNYTLASRSYDAQTRTLTLNYLGLPEDAYRLTIKSGDGSIKNLAGLDLDGDVDTVPGGNFVVNFALETITAAYPALTVVPRPAAAMVSEGTISNIIDLGTDTEEFTISLDAGQRITLLMDAASTLEPALSLLSPTGVLLDSATATAGGTAILETALVATAGVYRIVGASANGTIGTYAIRSVVNSTIELESNGGSGNGSLATAQPIGAGPVVIESTTAADRLAVRGTLAAGEEDWYSFPISSGSQQVAMTIASAASANLQIDFYNSSGALIVSSSNFGSNIDSAIEPSIGGPAGTYYARVTSSATTSIPYTLIVNRNSAIDVEPNDTPAAARSIGSWGNALGDLTSGDTADSYALNVANALPLQIRLVIPQSGTNDTTNTLSGRLVLINNLGVTVATSDTGTLNHTPTVGSGTVQYTLQVLPLSGTTGNYIVSVAGQAGGALPLNAVLVTPASNAFLDTMVTDVVNGDYIDIDLSKTPNGSTVNASDLTVNGIAAVNVVQRGGNQQQLRFFLPSGTIRNGSTGVTSNQVDIAGGAILDTVGTAISTYTATFDVDTTPPVVTNSSISNGQFLFRGNLTFTATFDEPIVAANLDSADFTLRGNGLSTNYTPGSLSYNTSARTLTLNYTNLPVDSYTLTLLSADGAFENQALRNLAGGGTNGNYVVNFSLELNEADAPTLTPVAPAGSLVYSGSFGSRVDFAGDTDSWLINLNPGQSISVRMSGTGSLQPQFTVLSPTGTTLATATAGAGAVAIAQGMSVSSAGVYRIVAGGGTSSIGDYTITAQLNGDIEAESVGGATNNTSSTAQDLTTAFVALPSGGSRAAVTGGVSAGVNDRFAFVTDSFETGPLGAAWTVASSLAAYGRTQLTTAYGAADGMRAMTMDVSRALGAFVRNEATWSVSVAGLNTPRLRFNHVNLGDEPHTMPLTFTGSVNGDGVAISTNGTNWYRVLQLPQSQYGVWQQADIDLVAAATAAGMSLSGNLLVKFVQYDNLVLPNDGRGFDNVQLTVRGTSDHYSFDAAAGETLSLGIAGAGAGAYEIRVFNPAGAQIATASTLAGGEIDAFLENLAIPTTGKYTIRVAASPTAPENYTLVLTKNANFNAEPRVAQPLPPSGAALGSVGIGGDVDEYTIVLTAGQEVSFFTRTPGDGTGQFINGLDPRLQVLNATDDVLATNDNDPIGDGRNARVTFTAPAAGTYRVRVSAAAGTGEYVLRTQFAPGGGLGEGTTGFGALAVNSSGPLTSNPFASPFSTRSILDELLRSGSTIGVL